MGLWTSADGNADAAEANPRDACPGVCRGAEPDCQKLKLMPPKPTTMSRFASAKVAATPVLT